MNHTIPSDLAALAKVFTQTSEALTQANRTAKFVEDNAAKTPTGRLTKASALLVVAADKKQAEALDADNAAEKAFQEAYWAWDKATFGAARIAEARANFAGIIGLTNDGYTVDVTDDYAARWEVVRKERGWKESVNHYGTTCFVLNVTPQYNKRSQTLRSIKSVERIYAPDYEGNKIVEVKWETHLRFSVDENGFFRAAQLYYGSRQEHVKGKSSDAVLGGWSIDVDRSLGGGVSSFSGTPSEIRAWATVITQAADISEALAPIQKRSRNDEALNLLDRAKAAVEGRII
jgi:hypothetical protein